jgi:hypothetical protein
VKRARGADAGGKPRLPRFRMPPPGKVHRDRKKEAARRACRRFRKTQAED